jgi:hypothetical protein
VRICAIGKASLVVVTGLALFSGTAGAATITTISNSSIVSYKADAFGDPGGCSGSPGAGPDGSCGSEAPAPKPGHRHG